MRRCVPIFAAFAVLWLLAPQATHADQFKLKDGSVIVGTVVGYEGNSFKVKTSYGYALVEKDKIVSIQLASAPESSPDKTSKAEAAKSPAAEKPAPEAAKNERSETHTGKKNAMAGSVDAASESRMDTVSSANSSPATASSAPASNAAPSAQNGSAVTPNTPQNSQPGAVAANASTAPPEPQPIREKISGNTYINDTYEFEMYKPPDWQIMDGARSVLPGAVAAMGTDDQSTYLVVGQEEAGKSAAAEIAATEKRLGEILADFRPLDNEHLTVSGQPVLAYRFRGSVDEHDWSGFMVFMPRGEKLYTIFGMTRADNDLVQIQENVIRRTIASFQFLPQETTPTN